MVSNKCEKLLSMYGGINPDVFLALLDDEAVEVTNEYDLTSYHFDDGSQIMTNGTSFKSLPNKDTLMDGITRRGTNH